MMPEGWKEALEMAERYRDYFSERDADIALGRSGTHFFYVYDKEHGYFEVFHTFYTAAELEELILGTLAEDLECMNAVMAENLHERFDLTDVNETLDNYAPRFQDGILRGLPGRRRRYVPRDAGADFPLPQAGRGH